LLLAAERRFAAEVVDPIWEAKVHDLRGTMLMSSGSVEQAQESFLRAYELLELAHAASVAAANDIAEIYATRGRFDEGLAWIDGVYDSLSIAHEDDPFELAPLWRTRGALLHEIGEYERSFAAFERSRELVEGRETDLARTFLLASLLGMIGALEAAHHPFLIMPLVDRCVDVATAQRDARSLVSCEWTCARILAQFERGEEAERALLRAYEHLVESRSEDELVQTWRIDDLVAFAADLDRFGQRSRARRLARVARRAAAERPELAPLRPSSVAELERLLGP
jgi:tetratricopeptide (TPR) repeat protein